MKTRYCRRCNAPITDSVHAWYCRACKEIAKKERQKRSEENRQIRKKGKKRLQVQQELWNRNSFSKECKTTEFFCSIAQMGKYALEGAYSGACKISSYVWASSDARL